MGHGQLGSAIASGGVPASMPIAESGKPDGVRLQSPGAIALWRRLARDSRSGCYAGLEHRLLVELSEGRERQHARPILEEGEPRPLERNRKTHMRDAHRAGRDREHARLLNHLVGMDSAEDGSFPDEILATG